MERTGGNFMRYFAHRHFAWTCWTESLPILRSGWKAEGKQQLTDTLELGLVTVRGSPYAIRRETTTAIRMHSTLFWAPHECRRIEGGWREMCWTQNCYNNTVLQGYNVRHSIKKLQSSKILTLRSYNLFVQLLLHSHSQTLCQLLH